MKKAAEKRATDGHSIKGGQQSSEKYTSVESAFSAFSEFFWGGNHYTRSLRVLMDVWS